MTRNFDKPALHAALILAASVLVYFNTLDVPFQFDDHLMFGPNDSVRDLSYFIDPERARALSNSAVYPFLVRRYVGVLSFALDYRAHGFSVGGYHVVNFAIHVASALCIYLMVRLLLSSPALMDAGRQAPMLGVSAAVVFAVHPVATQSVTYIVQRFSSLAALFYILSFCFYLMWRMGSGTARRSRYVAYAASLLTAVLAMKTKETAITLPLAMAAAEGLFFEGRRVRRAAGLAPFFLLMAVVPMSFMLIGGPLGERLSQETDVRGAISSGTYLITQFRVIATYLRLLVFPVNQSIDYDYPLLVSIADPRALAPLGLHIAVLCTALCAFACGRKRQGVEYALARLAAFGAIWFYLTLSVESSVIPIADAIMEYRIYLPAAGAVVSAVSLLYLGLSRASRRWGTGESAAFFMAVVMIAVPLGLSAHARNAKWHSEVSLWTDTVLKSPLKARPYNNLAAAMLEEGRFEEAVGVAGRAARLFPLSPGPYNNMGLAYAGMGDRDGAVAAYRKAAALAPSDCAPHTNLGIIHLKGDSPQAALGEFQQAMLLCPSNIGVYLNLGAAQAAMGQYDDALRSVSEALALSPLNADAHLALARLYIDTGRLKLAEQNIRMALAIDPNNPVARTLMGSIK